MIDQLTLYHYWRSSSSWRLRWGLAIKNLSYNEIVINLLKNEHSNPEFLKKNPSGQVPSLNIAGETFSESIALLEWLEETYPQNPILPQTTLDRLRVRELVNIIACGVQPIQNLKVQKFYEKSSGNSGKEFARHWIMQGFQSLENRMASGLAGTYCFGGNITMADLALIPQCYNALRLNIPLYRFPTIQGIYDRCLQTPACRKAEPENQSGAN